MVGSRRMGRRVDWTGRFGRGNFGREWRSRRGNFLDW